MARHLPSGENFTSSTCHGGRGLVREEMCSGSEAGSYLRLIDSCITQLKAQRPSRTCNEFKEEEKKYGAPPQTPRVRRDARRGFFRLGGSRFRRGDNLKKFKNFYLKARARI